MNPSAVMDAWFDPSCFSESSYGGTGPHRLRELELLGRGAFGTAVLVEEPRSGAKCVVKEINLAHLSASKQQAALREAHLLRRVMGSPFITNYMGSFVRDGVIYIAMEYCANGALDALIAARNGERFDDETLLDYAVQLCAAVRCHDSDPQRAVVFLAGLRGKGSDACGFAR
eukprot:6206725-Pleurochrysis_carterae.AAC.1